jgi:hypothetical protein
MTIIDISSRLQPEPDGPPKRQPRSIPHAEYIDLYADLCTWFWYHDHPEWEDDGMGHTSDECRRKANEVFDLLGLRQG